MKIEILIGPVMQDDVMARFDPAIPGGRYVEVEVPKRPRRVVRAFTGHGDDLQLHFDRPGDILHSQADISKAKRLLDYTPLVGLEDGLRQTLDWCRMPAVHP